MSNQITDPPNVYDAGLEFNYAVWTADTVITMCNVPWNNDYRDIVKFNNRAALDAYIDNAALSGIRIQNSRYAPVNMPVRLSVPFNKALGYNYLRANNPAQPIPGGDTQRSYYYFIVDVRYIAPQTTEIVVQLDVWQTYGYDVTFGNCYINRGHIGIANERQFDNYGRDYLTIPEGFDTGSDLRVVDYRSQDVMTAFGPNHMNVLVCSTVDLEANAGTVDNPKIVAAQGGTFSMIPSGATYYLFDSGDSFTNYLSKIKDTPWVAQGIISITMIPQIQRYYSGFTFNAFGTPTKAPTGAPSPRVFSMYVNWRENILEKLPERYRHLRKFLTFPYLAVEVTTWSGTPIVAKPEVWNDGNATISERVNLIPPQQRLQFMPYKYNNSGVVPMEYNDDGGDFLDFATMLQSFPTVAIVNNMASMYMAANASGLAFQHNSADWSQQKALAAAGTGYDQASSAMALMEQLGMTSRNLDIGQTALGNRNLGTQQIIGGLGSVGRGAVSGGVGGAPGMAIGTGAGLVDAITGNLNAMVQQGANTEALSMRNSAGVQNISDQVNNAAFQRDTNASLAEFAARGDYENSIAGINAKVQDSKFVQPTTVGQVGGDTMNIIYLNGEISIRFKMIDEARIRNIGDHWLRYGYAVNQFARMPESLMVMNKFTYWKLAETYITAGPMPEAHKQSIRGLFEKGVTVWTNPADIGNIDLADNKPLEGIVL